MCLTQNLWHKAVLVGIPPHLERTLSDPETEFLLLILHTTTVDSFPSPMDHLLHCPLLAKHGQSAWVPAAGVVKGIYGRSRERGNASSKVKYFLVIRV